jgi:enolase
MQELRILETSQLIDLLAKYTADYTKMFSDGTSEEDYEKLNITIKALQTEIELRKKAGSITPNPETDITTPPDFS